MNKQELRNKYIEHRRKMTMEQVSFLSQDIHEKLKSFVPFLDSKCIFSYLSQDNEVDTFGILKPLIGIKEICVPYIVDPKNSNMIAVKLFNFNNLEPSHYNIYAPTSLEEINPNKIDLVLVPGVCFARDGNRIGYGAGYYDKYLSKLKAVKIGLSYSDQLIDSIDDTNDDDVKVDYIITEKEIIKIAN